MINFREYDKENPQIWKMFKKFAWEAKYEKRFKSYSAKGIFELIRWHTAVGGSDGYKLNNNYTADYARKMMRKYPQFQGFFAVRQLKAVRGVEKLLE